MALIFDAAHHTRSGAPVNSARGAEIAGRFNNGNLGSSQLDCIYHILFLGTADACGSFAADALDHCVQLVGFHAADEPANSYWLVRNSWSTNWGENGYIRLQLNANTCGLANEASVPDILV